MRHKCRVFKSYWQGFNSGRLMWLGCCYESECYYYRAYFVNKTWEETVLEVLEHTHRHRSII